MGSIFIGCVIGFIVWFLVRYLVAGVYTVNQNERAVKTRFGRAERVGDAMTASDPIATQRMMCTPPPSRPSPQGEGESFPASLG